MVCSAANKCSEEMHGMLDDLTQAPPKQHTRAVQQQSWTNTKGGKGLLGIDQEDDLDELPVPESISEVPTEKSCVPRALNADPRGDGRGRESPLTLARHGCPLSQRLSVVVEAGTLAWSSRKPCLYPLMNGLPAVHITPPPFTHKPWRFDNKEHYDDAKLDRPGIKLHLRFILSSQHDQAAASAASSALLSTFLAGRSSAAPSSSRPRLFEVSLSPSSRSRRP